MWVTVGDGVISFQLHSYITQSTPLPTLLVGNSTLARVAQGQEPPHFVKVFSGLGGLVVHRGNRGEAAGADTRLYQVKAEAALGGPYAGLCWEEMCYSQ